MLATVGMWGWPCGALLCHCFSLTHADSLVRINSVCIKGWGDLCLIIFLPSGSTCCGHQELWSAPVSFGQAYSRMTPFHSTYPLPYTVQTTTRVSIKNISFHTWSNVWRNITSRMEPLCQQESWGKAASLAQGSFLLEPPLRAPQVGKLDSIGVEHMPCGRF